MDQSTSSVTDNPYYIRKMAKKNMNAMSSSTNTMLASTQHYSSRDIWIQLFNWENIEVQTKLSSKVGMWIIYLIGLSSFLFDYNSSVFVYNF